jgi:hypothetical protein
MILSSRDLLHQNFGEGARMVIYMHLISILDVIAPLQFARKSEIDDASSLRASRLSYEGFSTHASRASAGNIYGEESSIALGRYPQSMLPFAIASQIVPDDGHMAEDDPMHDFLSFVEDMGA